jgi:hypothetical protein
MRWFPSDCRLYPYQLLMPVETFDIATCRSMQAFVTNQLVSIHPFVFHLFTAHLHLTIIPLTSIFPSHLPLTGSSPH